MLGEMLRDQRAKPQLPYFSTFQAKRCWVPVSSHIVISCVSVQTSIPLWLTTIFVQTRCHHPPDLTSRVLWLEHDPLQPPRKMMLFFSEQNIYLTLYLCEDEIKKMSIDQSTFAIQTDGWFLGQCNTIDKSSVLKGLSSMSFPKDWVL